MDQYEDYFEEVSDNEVELGQQEAVVGVVVPQPVNVPLEVQVVPADKPESPSPSPATPSLKVASSPQVSPFGDATSLMGFCTRDDIVELEQWAVNARATRGDPTSGIDESDVSANLKTFQRYAQGTQWEVKIIRESG